jgi:hypothetical protein
MTVDEIFAPASSGKAYSIQDVLSAVGGQYQPSQMAAPQRSQSIDEILASLSGQTPASAAPFKSGAAQYLGDTQLTPSTPYTPAPFDLTEYQLKYANQMIAQGKDPRQAIEEAGLGEKIGSMAGAYYGNTLVPVFGGMIGGAIGGTLGSFVDDLF